LFSAIGAFGRTRAAEPAEPAATEAVDDVPPREVGPSEPAAEQPADQPPGENRPAETPAEGQPISSEPEPAFDDPAKLPAKISGPRDWFKLVGIDELFWDGLTDDAPLDQQERFKLYKLLFRLRSMPLTDVQRWAHGEPSFRQLHERPGFFRGELFRVRGRVLRVSREEMGADAAAKFNLGKCYRCSFEADDGAQVVVLAPAVPKEWKLDAPLNHRAAFTGLFAKRAASEARPDDENKAKAAADKVEPVEPAKEAVASSNDAEASEQSAGSGAKADEPAPDPAANGKQPGEPDLAQGRLVFVSTRLAWHPDTLLGRLGMDVGLLDTATDQTAISAEERECFYQMLSAVGHAKPDEIEGEAFGELERLKRELPEAIRQMPENSSEQRRARRQLARAQEDLMEVAPLFNNSGAQRGKLFVLSGDARRAIKVRVDDPDVKSRFGIDHYYEVEIFTGDSQNNPVVFCLRAVPEGMPIGEDINERVRIAGFFLKSWGYRTAASGKDAKAQKQLAPLLVGRQPEWFAKHSHDSLAGYVLLGLMIPGTIGIMFWAWRLSRSDRAHFDLAAARAHNAAHAEPAVNLNKLEFPSDDIEEPALPDPPHFGELREREGI